MQPFALIRPNKLDAAQKLAAQQPDTRALRAGGIDLLDRMKEGLDEPELLIELRDVLTRGARVADHEPLLPATDKSLHWPDAPRRAEIGALTTLAELAEASLPGADALVQAAGQAATPGIRNTATVGGNLLQRPRCWYFRNRDLVCLKKGGDTCLALLGDNRYHAILGGGPSFIVHPSSLATALTALDATVEIHHLPNGDDEQLDYELRELGKLFVTPKEDPTREHALLPGDVLTSVWIPLLDDMRSAYQAVREKQSHDWPLAEAAVRMCIGADGKMHSVRVALGHVAPIPWNCPAAAELLEGQTPDAALFAKAADAALSGAKPLDGNAYKVPMSRGLLREVLHRASGLALPE